MSFYPSYKEQFALLNNAQKKALKRIPQLEFIEGWLLLAEAAELFILTSKIKSERPVICEIGTWKGKSSYIFATALKSKGGLLYSVDPFNGDGDIASKKSYQEEIVKMDTTLLQNFKNTLKKFDLSRHVVILPFQSEEARSKFREQQIDLLFIDGNHDYNYVEKDYKLWASLIPPGGKIILHDVKAKHVNGPKRVMQECIIGNKAWKNVRIIGEMGIAERV